MPLRSRAIGLSLIAVLAVSGCATHPPDIRPSPPVAVPQPTEIRSAGSPTPTPRGTPSPSAPPSPGGSTGPTPVVSRAVDATVRAPALAPPLSSVTYADATSGWAAGQGVILGTTDGGKGWRAEWTGTRSITSLTAVDRLHAWGLASGTTAPAAHWLVRTADGGRVWTMTTLPAAFRAITFTTDRIGWAVVGGITDTTQGPGRLEKSSDGGLHWRASALASRVDSVCFAGPTVGWAASGSGVFRTLDGGRRWTRVAPGPNDAVNSGWFADIRCRASAAWALWTGGAAAGSEAYRVTRTLDGGAHWKTVLSQLNDTLGSLPTIDAYAGSFATASANAVGFIGWCPACGYGSTSFTRTTDGGRTFSHAPLPGLAGAFLGDITFPDPMHGWIAGSAAGGFLLASADGGRSWHRAYPSAALWPSVDMAFVTSTIGFGIGIVGDRRAVLRTDDGGRGWQAVGRLPVDPSTLDRDPILSFVDVRRGWVGTTTGVLATTDGGRTWRAVKGTPPGGVAFADRRHGCAGTFDTPAATTSDGGATWRPVRADRGIVACAASLIDPAWTAAAQPFDPGNLLSIGAILDGHAWALGYVETDRLGLEVTTDGGATWTAYRWPPLPDGGGGLESDTPLRVSFVTPTIGWMATLFGRIFETQDGGASWQELRPKS